MKTRVYTVRHAHHIIALCSSLFYMTLSGMAASTAAIPGTPTSPLPSTSPRAGQFIPLVDAHAASWGGRAFSVVEAGGSLGITGRCAITAIDVQSSGHGRSHANTYDGHGYRLLGKYQIGDTATTHPAYAIVLDHVSDDVNLHIHDSTTEADAWPSYRADGIQLAASQLRGQHTWQGRTGLYQVELDHQRLATVGLLGGGLSIPVGRHTTVQAELVSYRDNFQGRHFTYEFHGGVTLFRSARGSVTVGGSYFPRGIPLAGTPFSSASAAGLVYGNSAAQQLHDDGVGYLTLSGQLNF